MNNVISALTARTQLGQILRRATKNNERFVVDRRGEPSVVITSIRDYVDTIAPERGESSCGLFDAVLALAPDLGDLGVNLAHGELVRPPAVGSGLDVLDLLTFEWETSSTEQGDRPYASF